MKPSSRTIPEPKSIFPNIGYLDISLDLKNAVLIYEGEDLGETVEILEYLAMDYQKTGFVICRTAGGPVIALRKYIQLHFIPCSRGIAMEIYAKEGPCLVDIP